MGRPKGSKNRKYVKLECVPPRCPSCGSPDLKVIKGSRTIEREIGGVLPSGVEYRAIRWESCECVCGQYVKRRSYIPVQKSNTTASSKEREKRLQETSRAE